MAKRKRTTALGRVIVDLSTTYGEGCLSRLNEFPLDLLLEIFMHLHPRGLLNLARTTKGLRSIIMHRSAKGVWLAALESVDDRVEKPEDMSEPAYSSLLFDKECYLCGLRDTMDTIHWRLRKRVCDDCLQNSGLFISWRNAQDNQRYALACLFTTSIALLNNMIYYYSVPHLDIEVMHLSSLEGGKVDGLWLTRYNGIIARLRALGWGPTLTKMRKRFGHPLDSLPPFEALDTNRVHGLTDTEWIVVEEPILLTMKTQRQKIEREERHRSIQLRTAIAVRAILGALARHPSAHQLYPPIASIVLLPPFKDVILRQPIVDGPPIEPDDFLEALDLVPQLTAEWRSSVDAALLSMISPFNNHLATTRDFTLARTIFRCEVCCTVLFYPSPLIHSCRRWRFETSPHNDHDHQWIAEYADRTGDATPKSFSGRTSLVERIGFDSAASKRCEAVAKLLGYDPTMMTADELAKQTSWVVLQPSFGHGVKAMRVMYAVTQCTEQGSFRLLEEGEAHMVSEIVKDYKSEPLEISLHKRAVQGVRD